MLKPRDCNTDGHTYFLDNVSPIEKVEVEPGNIVEVTYGFYKCRNCVYTLTKSFVGEDLPFFVS